MQENWKDIPGYEGLYQVSDLGNARSVNRLINCGYGGTRYYRGKQLHPAASPSGHLSVVLRKGNTQRVHRLVLLAFVGPCPSGMEVLHVDHNPSNNTLANLCYGTRSENLRMDYVAGNRVGNRHPNFIGARWRA